MLCRSILFTACVILPLGISYAAPTNLYGIHARSGSTDTTSTDVRDAKLAARNPDTPKAIVEVAVKYTGKIFLWSGGSTQLNVKAKAEEYAKKNGGMTPEMILAKAGIHPDMKSLLEAQIAAEEAAEGKVHYVGKEADIKKDASTLDILKAKATEIIQVDPETGATKSIFTKPGTSPSKSVKGRSEDDDTGKTKPPKIKGWYYVQMGTAEGSLVNGEKTVDKGIPEGLSEDDVKKLVDGRPYTYKDTPATDREKMTKMIKDLIKAQREKNAAAKGGEDTDSNTDTGSKGNTNSNSSDDGNSSNTSNDGSDTKPSSKLGEPKKSTRSLARTRRANAGTTEGGEH